MTAISGSGPAYVFALTEALAVAAERLGLPAELAMNLARGTVEGSGELMRREGATSPATLRRNVTSPGGTTAAALAVLEGAGGLEDLMVRAAAAARARAAANGGIAGVLGRARPPFMPRLRRDTARLRIYVDLTRRRRSDHASEAAAPRMTSADAHRPACPVPGPPRRGASFLASARNSRQSFAPPDFPPRATRANAARGALFRTHRRR